MKNANNAPGLKLINLLRRRRLSLKQFITEFGITTYEGLTSRCQRMGVTPPTLQEFEEVAPPIVNSPTEGVLVLDVPPVVKEITGKEIDPDNGVEVATPPVITVEVLTEEGQLESILPSPTGEHEGPQVAPKKSKKKKVDTTEDDFS